MTSRSTPGKRLKLVSCKESQDTDGNSVSILCANYMASSSFLDIKIKDKLVSSHCEATIAYADINRKIFEY